MLIMNQDKDMLINLDQVTEVSIDHCDDVRFDIDVTFHDLSFQTIGSYKTEERVREILQQIADRQGCVSTYEMPEE